MQEIVGFFELSILHCSVLDGITIEAVTGSNSCIVNVDDNLSIDKPGSEVDAHDAVPFVDAMKTTTQMMMLTGTKDRDDQVEGAMRAHTCTIHPQSDWAKEHLHKCWLCLTKELQQKFKDRDPSVVDFVKNLQDIKTLMIGLCLALFREVSLKGCELFFKEIHEDYEDCQPMINSMISVQNGFCCKSRNGAYLALFLHCIPNLHMQHKDHWSMDYLKQSKELLLLLKVTHAMDTSAPVVVVYHDCNNNNTCLRQITHTCAVLPPMVIALDYNSYFEMQRDRLLCS